MKKFLLFAAVALVMTTAGAQLKAGTPIKKSVAAKESLSKLSNHGSIHQLSLDEISTMKEMKMGKETGKPVFGKQAPKKAVFLDPFYQRPAGMYVSPFIVADGGKGLYSYGNYAFMMCKPFADYQFKGVVGGADENTTTCWDVWAAGEYYPFDYTDEFYFSSTFAADDAPVFYAYDGDLEDPNADYYEYQMRSYNDDGTPIPVQILSVYASEQYEEDVDFMYSSKTMVNGGRYGNVDGLISRYYGAEPCPGNEYGWWFGKNASHVDGMAMIFEKPQNPYLLKHVYLQAYTDMVVNAPVKMTCKVYKIDEIPDYIMDNTTSATLPEVPGELVCIGEALLTPTIGADKNGLIDFTLKGYDPEDPELEFEVTPTIDYPIMVCVDGYNDESMADLQDFSAFVCLDDAVDEGYGELAYLKEGIMEVELTEEGDTVYDEDGNPKTYFTGEYYWRGLNNRFLARDDDEWPEKKATMMTGLTLFLGTENPFMTPNYGLEDYQYEFPVEGGEMVKRYEYEDTVVETEGVEICTLAPSDEWTITWNGDDEVLPDWLDIELVDEEEDGEFTNIVVINATAAPLPEGTKYREAIIRFSIDGDFMDYKFMQGTPDPIKRGDVNGDGEVNIMDVDCVIGIILGGPDTYEGRADVNEDGEINILDVDAIIAIILS